MKLTGTMVGLLIGGASCALPGGCATEPGTAANLAPVWDRSYVRSEEEVTLRLITWEEWLDANGPYIKLGITLPARLDPINDPPKDGERSLALAAEAVGAVVGLLVDVVKAEIEKEAARHEQQFTQTIYADDFWAKRGQPTYAGFEIVRTAHGYAGEKPAFRLICALIQSKADRRLLLIKPVYLRVLAAAAKVTPEPSGASQLTISANTIIQAARVDKDDKLELLDVADATFKWEGYSLDKSELLTASYDKNTNRWSGKLASSTAGYFLAPRGPVEGPQGWFEANKGGAFKLFVAITEKDDSKAQDVLLKFAEFTGAQKEMLIKAAKDRVNPPPSP